MASVAPFDRYSFQTRLASLRAAARSDAAEGEAPEVQRLYGDDEVAAMPALRWLSLNARMEHLSSIGALAPSTPTPSAFIPPLLSRRGEAALRAARRLPPLQSQRQRPQLPLAGESCPICLLDLDEATASDSTVADTSVPATDFYAPRVPRHEGHRSMVEWTVCCRRAFHSHCVQRLDRCPLCRTWPLRCEASHSQPYRADEVNRDLNGDRLPLPDVPEVQESEEMAAVQARARAQEVSALAPVHQAAAQEAYEAFVARLGG